ncbi:MAG: hypothetical protein ISS56_06765 [Anaerolineae bacterium]|nr:hypothetical protein [Anaerolineae bacterium]
METHLYLSMMPEALVASQLSPESFGTYYATGSEKKSRSQAMFFELDPDFRHPYFDIDAGYKRLVPHEDGTPKRSVYISVYRVLEHVPLSAIQKLYITTQDGRTLGLDASGTTPECEGGMHLYQEIAPVHPRVASTLCPEDFFELLNDPAKGMVTVPALCFVELTLGGLADNPEFGSSQGLPYSNMDHYRQCLLELRTKTVVVKMVDRIHRTAFHYRTVKSGFYLGNAGKMLFFLMPSQEVLRREHYQWWRSAQM